MIVRADKIKKFSLELKKKEEEWIDFLKDLYKEMHERKVDIEEIEDNLDLPGDYEDFQRASLEAMVERYCHEHREEVPNWVEDNTKVKSTIKRVFLEGTGKKDYYFEKRNIVLKENW